MTLWFLGSGRFGALCLERLAHLLGDDLSLVVTSLPTRAGRGLAERPSAVEACALEAGLAVERTGPLRENEALTARLRSSPPDAILVADFGQMIREPFLSASRWGCLNIHPSLLPRWRGAAPVQRALIAGDKETGVTVFRLTSGMDSGPILRQAAVPVTPETSAEGLYSSLSRLGAELMAEGLAALQRGEARLAEQDAEQATHAAKLTRDEFEVHWDWPAEQAHNTVRALDASGGAFIFLADGGGRRRLKLWRTSLKSGAGVPGQVLALEGNGPVLAWESGALRLDEVQAEGKRRTSGAEWARGLRLQVGDRLA